MMHDSHKCITWKHWLTFRFIQRLIFNISWLQKFSYPFCIFHLDNQHPIWWEKFPLWLNVLVYAHVSVGVFTRIPLFRLVDSTFQRMAGALADGCLAVCFPGSKVGQMYYFYSSFFDWRLIFVVVDCELLHRTEYDYSYAMRLIPTVFFLLTRSGLIK